MAGSRKKRPTRDKPQTAPILPEEAEVEEAAQAVLSPAPEQGKKPLLARIGVMNIILVVLAAGTVAFTLEMIQVFKQYGMIPDTLVQCFFVAVTGEAGFMGWIKTSKERRRDRKWQKEDERQAREDMERQSQGSGNA